MPTIPFGKHKGKEIGEVPTDYLLWFISSPYSNIYHEAAQSARYELKDRGERDLHTACCSLGKYKGREFSEIPTDYLLWVIEEMYDKSRWKETVRLAYAELTRREDDNPTITRRMIR